MLNISSKGEKGNAGTNGTNGTNGINADMTRSSTTSLLIEVASKTFVYSVSSSNLGWSIGTRLCAASASNPINYMQGLITAVSSTQVTINIDIIGGSGTKTDWNIFVIGNQGIKGDTGSTSYDAGTLSSHPITDFELFHGIYARSTVEGLNCLPTHITTTTFTLGTTANPLTYWYQGTKIIVNSNKTAVLDDQLGDSSAGLYFVYFDGATGNILATKTDTGNTITSNVKIAYVNWNGSNYGLVTDERHHYDRNMEWHNWAHNTVGCRYKNGVTLTHNSGTGAGATFSTTLGEIWDEDIVFSVPASSTFPTPNTCRLFYQNSATTYAFDNITSTTPFKMGVNDRPIYIDNNYNIVEMTPTARYINFFVYVLADMHTPIIIFAETVSATIASDNGYKSVTDARAAPFPNLSNLGLSPELKPIYRLIVKANGALQAIDTTLDDYRTVSSLPLSAGINTVTASAVSAIPTGNYLTASVQGQLEEAGSFISDLNILNLLGGLG